MFLFEANGKSIVNRQLAPARRDRRGAKRQSAHSHSESVLVS
jgi:hypothetical protein